MREHPEVRRAAGSGPEPDTGRRRFIQAGLAAAPLLVTLTARPAFAQDCEPTGSAGCYASATTTTTSDSLFEPSTSFLDSGGG